MKKSVMKQRHVRIPVLLEEAFEEQAEREYRSFNNLVAVAMQDYLAKKNGKK